MIVKVTDSHTYQRSALQVKTSSFTNLSYRALRDF